MIAFITPSIPTCLSLPSSKLDVRLRPCRYRSSFVSRKYAAHIPERSSATSVARSIRMSDNAPPIDAPSGILLLMSSVLAIASVGSVFELTGGHPTYGTQVTAIILAVSLPGFLFLFYSAIRKGQQEALDD